VGPPFYVLTFAPIFFALLFLVPFGPVLSWKRADLKAAAQSLYPALGLAAVAAVVVLAVISPRGLAATGAFAVAGWLIGASLLDIRRRRGARASAFAAALAHAGLGISLMGVAGTTAWRSEALTVLAPGQTVTVGPYTLRFDGVTQEKGPNYFADRAHIALMDGSRVKAMLLPEHRFYPAEGQDMNDTAIRTTGLRDLYLALGDDRGGGRFAFRVYVSPLAPLIWLGGLVMALGGMLSLWGRIRVREPEPAAPAVALAAE
jgi:cytochrome c-type biogenesis protein CcmF